MLTVTEILLATQGKLLQGNQNSRIKNVSTDSRSIKSGELFVAIPGEKFDGHDFILDVVKQGARALVVSKKVHVDDSSISIVLVADAVKAFGSIALFYRRKFNIPIIAITGSAGKTTTKELIAHVLSAKFKVLKNIKTENNHIGVPKTLLKLNSSYQAAVIEMGTNQFGDIPWLSKITQPTMAVFTNIGESHLQKLKNPQGVFKEKVSLTKEVSKTGAIIFNADDHYLKTIENKELTQEKISYSIVEKSNYQASHIDLKGNSKVQFRVGQDNFTLKTPVQHNVYNALAAIACARYLGVNCPSIQRKLALFKFTLGRQEMKKAGGVQLIDDTYNSNPISLKSAIKTLDALAAKGKKILVCADMLELGKSSRLLHQNIGEIIAQSTINVVFTFGQYAKYISSTVKKQNRSIETFHGDSIDDIDKRLKSICKPGDILLVKGSRGMQMERTINYLNKNLN